MSNFTSTPFQLKTPIYIPTNIPWKFVPNCTCRLAYSQCHKPAVYGKPVICVNERVKNIDAFLEAGPCAMGNEEQLSWLIVYSLLALIIALQIFMIIGYCWLNKSRIVFHCGCAADRNNAGRQRERQRNNSGIESARSVGLFQAAGTSAGSLASRPTTQPQESHRSLVTFLGSSVRTVLRKRPAVPSAQNEQANRRADNGFDEIDLAS